MHIEYFNAIFYAVFELNEYVFLNTEALQYAAAQYFCQVLCAATHGFLHTKKRRFIKIRTLSYFAILTNQVYRIFLNVLINIVEIRYLKLFQKSAGLMTPIVVWCLAWKEVKIVNILEKLYYGSIHPHEHALWNGGNNSELTENAIRHEKISELFSQNTQKVCLSSSKMRKQRFLISMKCRRLQPDFVWRLG